MLHPVLPPEPLPIVEPVQSASPTTPSVSALRLNPVAETTLENKEKSEGRREKLDSQTTGNTSTENQLQVAQTLSAPSPPETFPPEFSPIAASRSAASLGENLSIGYPLQQVQSSSPNTPAKILPKALKLKNLSQQQTASVEESAQPQNQSPTTTEQSPNRPPVQIEFKVRGEVTEPPPPDKNQTPSVPETQDNTTTPQQNQPSGKTPAPSTPTPGERIVEVTSDRQQYDEQRRVITAEGNVVVRFDGAVVDADRVQVNMDNLIAVGEGNVALTRGDQVLRGQKFTYNFIQDDGELLNGSGEVFIPSAGQDLSFLPTDVTTGGVPTRPLSDRIRQNQPLQAGSAGGLNVNLGGGGGASNIPVPKQGGQVRRVRFEAGRIDFYSRGWQARNVRLTNDPFSPPELEIRADTVTLTREAPLRDRIKTQRQRLVFDRGFSVPIPKDEEVIDRREREVTPGLFSIGYDGDQRGGLYIERSFKPIDTQGVQFSLTPQFYPQKAVQSGAGNVASLFGIKSTVRATVSPRTSLEGTGLLTSFDFNDVEDNLRASLRLRQLLLGEQNPHTLTLEYSYRDRLYNGTLGFQTVQSSFGGILTSPIIPLGKSGLNLSYQGGAQLIEANTDRSDLLEVDRRNNRVSLTRLQASAALNGGVTLWQGKPLPATPTQGLKYTANPVVPYVQAFGGLTGTTSHYSSGDNQSTLFATVGLQGQFGHFSRPFFDYTGFVISYSQGLNSGLSPFLFDRSVDNKVLRAGITQQIYGPFRFGFETSINLDTGERSSTDYVVEYSRRTYGISLRYNPVQQLGGISFRISDFNWSGGTDPFSDPSEVKPVVGGVRQR
ncbi:organic solvent tolerance protein OstA [Scytonema hofmannii PCC 7110]|uniref:Organic solvent tolerance protein OstA n=1 Tax=Scytonema hofmannii PCC 7110 TaxID=128403 RepID=A0A139X4G9_9CYAN|nr:DUF3769 domain-containing protein [Scytonema hofmannii]KYC39578.1 organic solvent tolerance protein OstA [Scytonema hofmannii PCC 7110]